MNQQRRIFDYFAPRQSRLLNEHIKDVIPRGVYDGMIVTQTGDSPSRNVWMSTGCLVTAQGIKVIEESDHRPLFNFEDGGEFPWPADGETHVVAIVCIHDYQEYDPETSNPPEAEYSFVVGKAALSDQVTHDDLVENYFPELYPNQTLIAYIIISSDDENIRNDMIHNVNMLTENKLWRKVGDHIYSLNIGNVGIGLEETRGEGEERIYAQQKLHVHGSTYISGKLGIGRRKSPDHQIDILVENGSSSLRISSEVIEEDYPQSIILEKIEEGTSTRSWLVRNSQEGSFDISKREGESEPETFLEINSSGNIGFGRTPDDEIKMIVKGGIRCDDGTNSYFPQDPNDVVIKGWLEDNFWTIAGGQSYCHLHFAAIDHQHNTFAADGILRGNSLHTHMVHISSVQAMNMIGTGAQEIIESEPDVEGGGGHTHQITIQWSHTITGFEAVSISDQHSSEEGGSHNLFIFGQTPLPEEYVSYWHKYASWVYPQVGDNNLYLGVGDHFTWAGAFARPYQLGGATLLYMGDAPQDVEIPAGASMIDDFSDCHLKIDGRLAVRGNMVVEGQYTGRTNHKYPRVYFGKHANSFIQFHPGDATSLPSFQAYSYKDGEYRQVWVNYLMEQGDSYGHWGMPVFPWTSSDHIKDMVPGEKAKVGMAWMDGAHHRLIVCRDASSQPKRWLPVRNGSSSWTGLPV